MIQIFSQTSEHQSKNFYQAACGILTISDTRTEETDQSGYCIRNLLIQAGHKISLYKIIPDEPIQIDWLVKQCSNDENIEILLLNGGTGISHRDTTFEVLSKLFEKTLPGFGEIFRMLSYEEIGPAAFLSRATAGTIKGKVIFSLPGSTGAVKLAMEKLILPQLSHLISELRR